MENKLNEKVKRYGIPGAVGLVVGLLLVIPVSGAANGARDRAEERATVAEADLAEAQEQARADLDEAEQALQDTVAQAEQERADAELQEAYTGCLWWNGGLLYGTFGDQAMSTEGVTAVADHCDAELAKGEAAFIENFVIDRDPNA